MTSRSPITWNLRTVSFVVCCQLRTKKCSHPVTGIILENFNRKALVNRSWTTLRQLGLHRHAKFWNEFCLISKRDSVGAKPYIWNSALEPPQSSWETSSTENPFMAYLLYCNFNNLFSTGFVLYTFAYGLYHLTNLHQSLTNVLRSATVSIRNRNNFSTTNKNRKIPEIFFPICAGFILFMLYESLQHKNISQEWLKMYTFHWNWWRKEEILCIDTVIFYKMCYICSAIAVLII